MGFPFGFIRQNFPTSKIVATFRWMTPDLQLDTKKLVLEALEAYHGIISDACRKVGISRQAYYDWLKNDPEFKAAADEIGETAIDFVEGKLFEKINGVLASTKDDEDGEPVVYKIPPSDVAITFFMRTKAKKRGYQERQEVIFPEGLGITWNEERTYDDKKEG